MATAQPRSTGLIPAGWLGLVALATVIGLTLTTADRSSTLTRSTIHLALFEYALALSLMMRMSLDDWRVLTHRGQIARWLWTWACVTFLIHVACAFHFSHRWSHTHAFEQTRLESGFGEGLYVNYLFIALWICDVSWWWINPERYALRPRWIDRLLHGFMLFIAFNATVVFERGAIRYAGLIGTLLLAMRWFQKPPINAVNASASDH